MLCVKSKFKTSIELFKIKLSLVSQIFPKHRNKYIQLRITCLFVCFVKLKRLFVSNSQMLLISLRILCLFWSFPVTENKPRESSEIYLTLRQDTSLVVRRREESEQFTPSPFFFLPNIHSERLFNTVDVIVLFLAFLYVTEQGSQSLLSWQDDVLTKVG